MPGVLKDLNLIDIPPDLAIEAGETMSLQDKPDFDPVEFALEYLNLSGSKDSEPENENSSDDTHLEIKEPFQILKNVRKLKAADDIAIYLIAIERILENINKMNLYADCEQFEIKNLLGNCLLSKHVDIKKGICDIVTQICNTEPDCKEFFTNRRFIFELLDILNYSIDEEFVTKALDALIAILNCNLEGLQFLQYNSGISIFLNTLRKDKEDWNIKIVKYFQETCTLERQLPLTLISQDYIPEIVILLAKERKRSHYYLIKLLTILVEQDYDALDELSRANLNVKEILNGLLESSAGRPDLKEERDACIWLLESISNLEIGRPLYDRG